MDTFEGDNDAEDPSALIGTYGSDSDRLAKHVTTITSNDSFDDAIDMDHTSTTETISYDLGAGTRTAFIDSGYFADAVVTFTDGTQISENVGVIQDDNGELFLLIGDAQTSLDDKPISSLQINSVLSTAFDNASQLSRDDLEFVCFAPGTLIDVPAGRRAVESLQPGDLVLTEDRGPQPLVWTGSRRLVFGPEPHPQKPVHVPRGALAEDVPVQDLIVSPQHRFLIGGESLRARHRIDEALAPVKGLIGRRGIRQMRGKRGIVYVTLLFQRHELIRANGALVESFLPRRYALTLLDVEQRSQVLRALPKVWLDSETGYGPPARPLLGKGQVQRLGECTRGVQTRPREFAAAETRRRI